MDATVADCTNLLAVEALPALAVEACHQRRDVPRREHVDEGIPNVALVLEINGQVEKVKGAFELLLNRLQLRSRRE